MVLDFLSECCDVLNEFIKVIFGEIDTRFLILLHLLQYRFVVILHLELSLIEILDAIFVDLKCSLHFVLGIETLIHYFLHFLNRNVPLFLVEQSLFDFDLHLVGLMAKIHVLSLCLLMVGLLLQ